jgi:energy-coupling factor transporter ATP-binding protein EcfA2
MSKPTITLTGLPGGTELRLEVEPGVIAFKGKSGAGKTTALEALCGVLGLGAGFRPGVDDHDGVQARIHGTIPAPAQAVPPGMVEAIGTLMEPAGATEEVRSKNAVGALATLLHEDCDDESALRLLGEHAGLWEALRSRIKRGSVIETAQLLSNALHRDKRQARQRAEHEDQQAERYRAELEAITRAAEEQRQKAADFEAAAARIRENLAALLADLDIGEVRVVVEDDDGARLEALHEGAWKDWAITPTGHRVSLALELALNHLGPCVPIKWEIFAALDPQQRAELVAAAEQRGVTVVTEAPGQGGPLRVERVGR